MRLVDKHYHLLPRKKKHYPCSMDLTFSTYGIVRTYRVIKTGQQYDLNASNFIYKDEKLIHDILKSQYFRRF